MICTCPLCLTPIQSHHRIVGLIFSQVEEDVATFGWLIGCTGIQEEPTIAVEVFQTMGGLHGSDQKSLQWHVSTLYASRQSKANIESLGSFFSLNQAGVATLAWKKGVLGHQMSQSLLWRCFKPLVGCMG